MVDMGMTPKPDVKYQVLRLPACSRESGLVDVEGVQVGRLAVRLEPEECLGVLAGRLGVIEPGWYIDHMPSHMHIWCGADTFAEAMVIADDTSRFAPHDLTADNFEQLTEQLGQSLCDWLGSITPDHIIPYRKWLAGRDAA